MLLCFLTKHIGTKRKNKTTQVRNLLLVLNKTTNATNRASEKIVLFVELFKLQQNALFLFDGGAFGKKNHGVNKAADYFK